MFGSLERAIAAGQIDQLQLVYADPRRQATREICTADGKSPLVAALRIENARRRTRVFNFLLPNVNLTRRDAERGWDLLAWACCLGRDEQISKLLDDSPGEFNLREPDSDGNSPLHLAVRSGNPLAVYHVVKEMRRFGVSVDLHSPKDGMTPFLLAKRLGFDTIAQILLTEGKASPSQFDTKRFRTKTRWAEIGRDERNKSDLKEMIAELRLNGSTRPQTSFQKRRDVLNRPQTSPESYVRPPKRELYPDLEVSDVIQIGDGKTSVKSVRRSHNFPLGSSGESMEKSEESSGTQSRSAPSERNLAWTKLNSLMSMSDKATVPHTAGFARSTSSVGATAAAPEADLATLIPTMFTAMSQQMTKSFRKPAIPKPVAPPKPEPPKRKKKKGSTLAFILNTAPGGRGRSTHARGAKQTASHAKGKPRYSFGHRSSVVSIPKAQRPKLPSIKS